MLENIESVYITPNYSSTVYLLRTNTASNTAVRAPGLLQAAAVSETMLDELAATISMDKEEIRLRNMMTEQQCTPNVKGEGTAIADYNLPRIWSELEGNAQIAARKAQVDSFNQANRWKKRGIAMSPLRYGFGHGHVAGSNVTINVHASNPDLAVPSLLEPPLSHFRYTKAIYLYMNPCCYIFAHAHARVHTPVTFYQYPVIFSSNFISLRAISNSKHLVFVFKCVLAPM